ncbi:MAG TPA: histidine ammonia-lyase [Candidatus Cloacimonadota bacterium]|nr:histidine ammonia-lyase [Candidatus Cloacimonadota bacterium]HPT70653.1 histidine ammonia-lyase [Candidatus Cloacimonadota bacterium]
MDRVYLNGSDLTFEQIWSIAYQMTEVSLTDEAAQNVKVCREYVDRIIREGRVVYGLTTGFGKFSTISIPADQIDELQENLILSHATGVGPFLSISETRAILLLRINVLARGHSGIRLETLQALIDMLNKGVHPCIPEKGSVGASGDLAPLSHLALVLLGKGKAYFHDELLDGAEAMNRAGIKPVKLMAKEGLALNNGTQVMTAVGILTLIRAYNLVKVADICAAFSLDAMKGTPAAYDPLIHGLRPHSGQLTSADNLFRLIQGSRIRESHLTCSNVQDPYSLRCTPQVHGAVREALDYVKKVLSVEMNSVTDNPLIFPREERVISGGNFHGEPVAIALDTLGIAVSELANISERRMEQIFNPALNRGLKPFLAPRPGVDSGFMIAQLTAASLVSENKVLAHPASVDSIPTSANQEDHVSMGTISAMKARTIINNVAYVLGIELMSGCQALDEREMQSSDVIEEVKAKIRSIVPHLDKDRILYDDIQKMKDLIDSTTLPDLVSKIIPLN